MRHDSEFIRQIQRNPAWKVLRADAADRATSKYRPLLTGEVAALLDLIEDGHARYEQISVAMDIPVKIVAEVYDLWIDTYDPEPPKRETLTQRLQREANEEWERDTE